METTSYRSRRYGPFNRVLALRTRSIPPGVGICGNDDVCVFAKCRSWKYRKKSELLRSKVDINWLKLANTLSMYRSPRLRSPLFSNTENRESIFAGTNRCLLQIGVTRGRVSHPKWRLICVQIFNVPRTTGLEVKLDGGEFKVLHAKASNDEEQEADSL